MNQIFLGKPSHWLLLAAIAGVMGFMGAGHFHVRAFPLFILSLVGIAAGCLLFVVATRHPLERITRDPIEPEPSGAQSLEAESSGTNISGVRNWGEDS